MGLELIAQAGCSRILRYPQHVVAGVEVCLCPHRNSEEGVGVAEVEVGENGDS